MANSPCRGRAHRRSNAAEPRRSLHLPKLKNVPSRGTSSSVWGSTRSPWLHPRRRCAARVQMRNLLEQQTPKTLKCRSNDEPDATYTRSQAPKRAGPRAANCDRCLGDARRIAPRSFVRPRPCPCPAKRRRGTRRAAKVLGARPPSPWTYRSRKRVYLLGALESAPSWPSSRDRDGSLQRGRVLARVRQVRVAPTVTRSRALHLVWQRG